MEPEARAANAPERPERANPDATEVEAERIGDEEFDAALGQGDAAAAERPLRDVPLDAEEALGAG